MNADETRTDTTLATETHGRHGMFKTEEGIQQSAQAFRSFRVFRVIPWLICFYLRPDLVYDNASGFSLKSYIASNASYLSGLIIAQLSGANFS